MKSGLWTGGLSEEGGRSSWRSTCHGERESMELPW
jgi:hypothetical protein